MPDPLRPEPRRRHDLLDLEPDAWAAALAARPDLAGVPRVADWAQRGWPVILRRRNPGEAAGAVPVGLPLPPAEGKRRIGLGLPAAAVRPRPPVALAQASGTAPEAWRPTLAALDALGRRHGVAPRVFGGLLWQHLTGLAYLSDTSDLDLLWPVAGAIDRRLLDALAAIEQAAPMRLDGEIVLPDGRGVNWRELHAASPDDTVLTKHRDGLALCAARALGYAGEAA
ncbi:malonate decarboxylase holo-[acyl-carrier-protein] synthase [Methylobacterium soli]|uniref:Malonate decarboxylase holo-[acyl-carrier-protein] synthase n=1 Tax=Methylobacterium soli TaxID=553447 RepID=A0A6L3SXS7_9HYPH|nr:malonate decarboxylase holo-[acyl-carrier-protein] synthase [Methylobacterium soli]KAB1076966.1 malonate decarboxylase holo-[acyl-carrier-protein] synthase [Methylobacterium soli]GJE44163.1 Phosphoribosyl-dephospho-CoA transferase [Methylobacterium soli]